MYCVGRNLESVSSILADFAHSGWDPTHLGRKSDPYTIRVEAGALEKVACASGIFGRRRPSATFPYYWHLINNTPVYRKYEAYVQHGVGDNIAHLHTGDVYRSYHPMRPGDLITVTVELTTLRERPGRQGPIKFIEDVWRFHNQDNELAGELVRKVATIYYENRGTTGVPDLAPDPASLVPGGRLHRIDRGSWDGPGIDLFDGGPSGFVHEIGPVTWTMMVQWMGAVDDYARTHYDFDYAKERGFPGGLPISAGPHMGALMLAPVMAWAGPEAWIEEFDHVQRHPVTPNERLSTFGAIDPAGSDGERVRIRSWLVDEERRVRNWASFVVRRRAP